MKKFTKGCLITALVLFIVGLIICGVGGLLGGFRELSEMDGIGSIPFRYYRNVESDWIGFKQFQKVFTADGTQWYKQYAQDSVERKPYMATDDTVAYHEKIVKKMPDPPRRKDRM